MPATSQAQQRLMAIAEHAPGKLRGKKPDMTRAQLHDFAATKTKGLPEHVKAKPFRAAGPGLEGLVRGG